MAAAMKFPADPALRRQLWRQWVHLDEPRSQEKARPVRRATKQSPQTQPSTETWARSTIEATPGVVDGLRAAIAAAVVNGQLSNADRQRFITRAVRLGLSRFDASLLVAAVQHQKAEESGITVRAVWKQLPRRKRSVAGIVGACLALEAIAVTAVAAWIKA